MKIQDTWEQMQKLCQSEADQSKLWNEYYQQETDAYRAILGDKRFTLTGTVQEIADSLNMEIAVFAPFADGINSSLKTPLDTAALEESTAVNMEIEPEKLYYNMLTAKAKWLYTLKEWDGVLTEEKRTEITRAWRQDHQAVSNKVGRNDPCPCGSGKKYKNCCGR